MRSVPRSVSLGALDVVVTYASALSTFAIAFVVLTGAGLGSRAIAAGSGVAAVCAGAFVALHPRAVGRARGMYAILAASGVVGAVADLAAGRPIANGIAIGVTLGLLPAGLAALVIRATLARRARLRTDGALDAVEQVVLLPSTLATVGASVAWAIGGAPLPAVAGLFGLGILGLVLVVLRDARRASFLERVKQGKAPGLELVTELERETSDFVPPVTSTPLMDAFVVEHHGAGTYRGGGVRPVLRCHATLSRTLAPIRTRFAVAAIAGCVALPMVAAGAMARTRVDAPRPAPSADLSTPTCSLASAFFADRARHEVAGVGAAVLLTHETDATVAPGDAKLVLAPTTSAPLDETMRSQAERMAAAVPCRDKLRVTVVEATYVEVALEIKLTLDGTRTAQAVREEAEHLVRSLFAPEGRGDPDHVDFGAADRTVGWKVLYALKQVPGVGNVSLKVDGETHDRVLGPAEMPTLGSLVVR